MGAGWFGCSICFLRSGLDALKLARLIQIEQQIQATLAKARVDCILELERNTWDWLHRAANTFRSQRWIGNGLVRFRFTMTSGAFFIGRSPLWCKPKGTIGKRKKMKIRTEQKSQDSEVQWVKPKSYHILNHVITYNGSMLTSILLVLQFRVQNCQLWEVLFMTVSLFFYADFYNIMADIFC